MRERILSSQGRDNITQGNVVSKEISSYYLLLKPKPKPNDWGILSARTVNKKVGISSRSPFEYHPSLLPTRMKRQIKVHVISRFRCEVRKAGVMLTQVDHATMIISIYRLDIFDNVGIECLLETGASTSKVTVILLSGSSTTLLGSFSEC